MANSTIVQGRPCKGCPTWITPGPRERNKRLWCSDGCRRKAYYRENPEKYEEQKRRARERQKAKRAERGPLEYAKICGGCGEEFTSKRVDVLSCSRLCGDKIQLRKQNAAYVLKRYDRVCPECGADFVAARVNKIYCSTECNRAVQYRKEKSRKIRKRYIRRCGSCGGFYTADQVTSRYCSKTCSSREHKARREYLKRTRSNGVEFTDVTRLEVYERDGWTCQLCGIETSRVFSNDDPWSPTLDHIVPLARGGAHTVGNSQLAHYICNSLKSDGEFSTARLVGYELEKRPC